MFGFWRAPRETTGIERAALRPKRMLPKEALVDLPSRQRRRAKERAEVKTGLHNAKMHAMRSKRPGGAAAVR